MTVTLSPTSPIAGEETTITPDKTAGEGATIFAIELSEVPSASALTLGFLTTDLPSSYTTRSEPQTSVETVALTADVPPSASALLLANIAGDTFTPDVPGVYTFEVFEYRDSNPPATHARGREERRLTFVGQRTETVEVSQQLALTIVDSSGNHGVTLRLRVDDDTVRAAEFITPTTEVARVAALETSVVAALADLVGLSALELGEDLIARVADAQEVWAAHLADTTAHTAADTINVLTTGIPTTVAGAILALNEWRQKFIAHTQERDGTAHHHNDDLTSIPRARPATTLADAIVLEADMARAYGEHRLLGTSSDPTIHDKSEDRINALRKPVAAAILAEQDEPTDTETLTDYTTAANNATTGDVALLGATGDWEVGDAFYVASPVPFTEVAFAISVIADSGDDTMLVGEYWDGIAWATLPDWLDDSGSFRIIGTQVASWTMPDDWARTTINSQGPWFFIRLRVTVAVASPVARPLASRIYLREAPSYLSRAIRAYLLEVTRQDPTVATGELQGAADAASRYGFRRL